jgi:hypothetical protein
VIRHRQNRFFAVAFEGTGESARNDGDPVAGVILTAPHPAPPNPERLRFRRIVQRCGIVDRFRTSMVHKL